MSEAIVQRACAKIRSAIVDEAVARLNFTGDLQETLDELERIQPLMQKTEMRPSWDQPASRWLQLVRRTSYRVMDMVDELQDTRSQAAATMTRMLPRLAIKMKETKEILMVLQKDWHDNLSAEASTVSQARFHHRMTGSSVFEEAMVFGRGTDKQRIMTMLHSAACNITQGPPSCIVLPIFGFAGSGKTTLAQMFFKNTGSLQNYDFRVWVHVSPHFELHKIGESIIRQVSQGGGQEHRGMEHIMERLRELCNGKKMLVVLDDLWEEDSIQLLRLKYMLTLGEKVDVIVTTCNHAIARKISTVQPYRLNPLSDDTCWEIIKQSTRSRTEEEEEEKLEKIGREIARKCHGLPSVARAFTRMLDSRDPTRWGEATDMLDILFSDDSRSPISALELSHRSMPPGLRLCFAYYCDIFPKGHNIVKGDLIHHWIAHHLIEPSKILTATQIAEDYITRLLDMAFLQTAKSEHACENDDKGVAMLTMDNLAHDLASWMSKKLDKACVHYMLVTNCHGKLDDLYDDDLRALRCVGCNKVEFNDDSFSRKKNLRVLELNESYMQKLPDSICKLRRLGYLKITEFYGLVSLPESFGHLTNLFHVDLSGCSGLINLPESFGKLILLVHLNLSGCSGLVTLQESFGNLIRLEHMNLSGCTELVTLPESFGKLISLVHVNLSGCSGLVNLPGSFGKLISSMHVNLSGCSRLVTLPGSFGRLIKLSHIDLSGCSGLVNLPESFGKLIRLAHVNLSGCTGLATLPESFENLMNLSHIDLSRCHGLSKLPEPLHKLGKLVHLDLSFWSCFEGIGKALAGLTNLEHLNLSHPCCQLAQQRFHLQELKDGLCKLTSLRYLNLSMCLNPILYHHKSHQEGLQYIQSCLSALSSLEHLDLSHNTFVLDLPQSLGGLNRLHTLDLSGCIRLKKLGEIKSLRFIALRNCKGLESCNFVVRVVDDDDAYSSSNIVQLEDVSCQELQISCLEKVQSIEEAQRTRLVEKKNLEKLKLSWTLDSIRSIEDSALLEGLVPAPNLQCLEVSGYDGTCLPEYLGDLTSLQELKIVCCKQLNSFPGSIKKLTNLKHLLISGCQPLEKWCQLRENKKKLAHIPKKTYGEDGSTSRQ